MPRPRHSAATARQHRKPLTRKTKKPPRSTFTGWATTDEEERNRRPAKRVSEIRLDNTESPPTVTWHDLGEWQGENLPDALKLLTGRPCHSPALVTMLLNVLSKLPPTQRKRWRLSNEMS